MTAAPLSLKSILTGLLKLPKNAKDYEVVCAVIDLTRNISLQAIRNEAAELEIAAKAATKTGMVNSGATLRNRAAGLRRAVQIFTQEDPAS